MVTMFENKKSSDPIEIGVHLNQKHRTEQRGIYFPEGPVKVNFDHSQFPIIISRLNYFSPPEHNPTCPEEKYRVALIIAIRIGYCIPIICSDQRVQDITNFMAKSEKYA